MAAQVDQEAPADGGTVVSVGPLDGLVGVEAGENPVTELASDGQQSAEEAGSEKVSEFADAGQEELVGDDATFQPGGADGGREGESIGERRGGGPFVVGGPARCDGTSDEGLAKERGGGVEEHLLSAVGEDVFEIGGGGANAVGVGAAVQLASVATDDHGVGQAGELQRDADVALPKDGDDGPGDVMMGALGPGDATHNDPDSPCLHRQMLDKCLGYKHLKMPTRSQTDAVNRGDQGRSRIRTDE